ncbi:Protease HtpX [Candidatus Entotheonellaceae bacterium PAL068K]
MYASLHSQHHVNNKRRHAVQSVLLLGGMALLLALLGWSIAGFVGLLFAAAAMVALLMGPWISPRLLLHLNRARPLTPYEAPGLYRLLHVLAQRAELTALPHLYVVPSAMMNAFTVGPRDDAAIAVTDGLVRGLNQRELIGVLAHEISHIRHNDTWVMGLAEVVRRVTSVLSFAGQLLLWVSIPMMLLGTYSPPWLSLLLLIAAPVLSALMQLALSRTREFDADLDAVRLTGDPAGLASALDTLERYQGGFLARVFRPRQRNSDSAWLRTHPTTTERIRRLLLLQDQEATRAKPHGFQYAWL